MNGTIPPAGGAGNLFDPFRDDHDRTGREGRAVCGFDVRVGDEVEVHLADGGRICGKFDGWCGVDVPALWVELADGPAILLLPTGAQLKRPGDARAGRFEDAG